MADPPNLAGFVVDKFVTDGLGILGFIALLVTAFYPGLAQYSVIGSLSFTMIFGGWNAQNQYDLFRGYDSAADIVGKEIRTSLPQSQRESVIIFATSRLDGRVAHSGWIQTMPSLFCPIVRMYLI